MPSFFARESSSSRLPYEMEEQGHERELLTHSDEYAVKYVKSTSPKRRKTILMLMLLVSAVLLYWHTRSRQLHNSKTTTNTNSISNQNMTYTPSYSFLPTSESSETINSDPTQAYINQIKTEDVYHKENDAVKKVVVGNIPNIAHFVRQLNRHANGTAKPLSYEFRHFMAYYSAHHYLKPDSINIWSDVTKEMLEEAKKEGDEITKAVLAIPKLKFHHVTMPSKTSTGHEIKAYAHKSDFVRTRVMAEHGGQYFDDDAWVIRDLAPLRSAGYENVFGIEAMGDVCQAVWMSTPKNALMSVFERLQDKVFDGGWLTASNSLITNLIHDIRGYSHDRHALVLERDAFFPGQWDLSDAGLPMYYKVQSGEADDVPGPIIGNLDELVDNYKKNRNYGWKRDWRSSYVIHGYSNAIRDLKAEYLFKPYQGFTPEYILSQQSNIGRALYPALKDAIDNGFLTVNTTTITTNTTTTTITTPTSNTTTSVVVA